MTNDLLQQAISLTQAGQKDRARELLQQVLSANPSNETAWLWLTDCVSDPAERIQVLETCLRFVPNSRAAQAGLAALRQQVSKQQEPETAPAAPAEPGEAENEWPDLQEQIQLEPWMEEMSDEAGPVLGALLGNAEESEGLPGHARAYDNLPTLPARHFEPSPAFTVSPGEVAEEGFGEVEAPAEPELRARPEAYPVPIQPEEELPQPGELVTQAEIAAEEERPFAEEVFDQQQDQILDLPGGGILETPDTADRPDLGRTAPHQARRKAAARKKASRNRTVLYLLLFIIGLIAIAAVLFAIILSL